MPQNDEKTQKTTHSQEIHVPTPEGVEYPEEDISPEDIPF